MAVLSVALDQGKLNELLRRFGPIKSKRILKKPMQRSTALLQRDLATYPPPARKPQPAKSRRQQIKQILLAKAGQIPYRRTGTLGRAWTSDVAEETEGFVGRVGNATRYGPLVEGYGTQAGYHQGVWQTDRAVMHRRQEAILDDFEDTLDAALGGKF